MKLVESVLVPVFIGVIASGATIYVNESNRQEQENVETTLRYLLSYKEDWKLRSFGAIKQYFGNAYTDEELKKHLIAAGALQFPDNEKPGEYWWGLTSKNLDRLK
ncbi:hypothetical protein [Teredinibacter sp. KSP-S5-2]|uniref:hypothetical protein n=1 Tax=Teredinibacter sp. KSP-S5-2 TaxID=3034506 RepID=UPI0029347F6C|nr:hypothetical protein [Teredinibacter sp. KSP-S5-2]WNO09986.1 hypothetical protein P5V12_02255 [Teredinibacter sp. KSP-S5-2]